MLFEVGSDSLLTPVPAHEGCKGDCAMSNCFSDRLSLSQNRIISSLALHLGLWNPPASLQLLNPFSPTAACPALGQDWAPAGTFCRFVLFFSSWFCPFPNMQSLLGCRGQDRKGTVIAQYSVFVKYHREM